MARLHHRSPEERERACLEMLLAVELHQRELAYGISFGELKDRPGYGSKDKVSRDLDWLAERGWLLKVPRRARSLRVTAAGLEQLRTHFPEHIAAEPAERVTHHAAAVAWPLRPAPVLPRRTHAAAQTEGRRRARRGRPTADFVPVVPLAIAAGPPLEYFESFSAEEVDTWLPVPAGSVRTPERCFAVGVRGDSMRDAHILDGDLVVLRLTETARPGQIVGVLLPEQGVTLKRYMPEPAHSRIRFKAENPDIDDILVDLSGDEDLDAPMPQIIGVFETLHRGLGPLAE